MDLASEIITDKEQFFSKLDLVTYEGRYRANALLKRLKIKVYINRDDASCCGYAIFRNDKTLITYMQIGGAIAPIHYIEELDERVKLQDAQKEPYLVVDF